MTSTTPKSDAQLMSLRELAALCGVSLRTASRWLESNIIPQPLRIGRGPSPMIRFRRDEIQAWIAAGCPARDQQ